MGPSFAKASDGKRKAPINHPVARSAEGGHLRGGVFVPNSPLRSEVRLKPKEKKGFDFDDNGNKKYKNMRWAKMLARVFKLDVLKCTTCGGELKPVCSVMSSESVKRYLDHVGINSDPPQRAPPQYVQHELEFNQSHL